MKLLVWQTQEINFFVEDLRLAVSSVGKLYDIQVLGDEAAQESSSSERRQHSGFRVEAYSGHRFWV